MSFKDRIAKKFKKDRVMAPISIRMYEDVIDDLKLVAERLGFSGYQALIRFYVGQGLRKDLQEIEESKIEMIFSILKNRGVNDSILEELNNIGEKPTI